MNTASRSGQLDSEKDNPGVSGPPAARSASDLGGQPRAGAKRRARRRGASTSPTGPEQTFYLHQEALGSVGLVTDNQGGETERTYVGPFGEKVDVFGDLTTPLLGVVKLGFTGHRHGDHLGLMDAKGRIFDPVQKRFLTPDPCVADPLSSQSHNRFSAAPEDLGRVLRASLRRSQLELETEAFDPGRLSDVALELREIFSMQDRARLERRVTAAFIARLVEDVSRGFRGDVGVGD